MTIPLVMQNEDRIIVLEEWVSRLTTYCNQLYDYMMDDHGGVVPKPPEVKQ